MLLRHKVPTIFNIYMLDVICCALGCVVLLWQVAHQEAETQTASARQSQSDAQSQSAAAVRARKQYEKAQSDFLSAANDVTALQKTLADWRDKHQTLSGILAATRKERDDARAMAADRLNVLDKTRTNLALSREQLKKLEDDLEKLLASYKKSTAEKTGLVKLNAELLAKIALAGKQVATVKDELSLGSKKAQQQAGLLKLSEENARKLQLLLAALRDDSKKTQAKLTLTELQLKMRQQELDKSRTDILTLLTTKGNLAKNLKAGAKELLDAKDLIAALTAERDGWKDKVGANAKELSGARLEKDRLTRRIADLQAEVDQRFAGIPLTGENVIFLIDISGSMALKDENTDDPEKWPFLCETLMKLMKSIPTMRRFQIILFSDKTSYLFGKRDSWFKYEGPATAKMARDALRKIKVEGGTNMHDAFDEAFRYRKSQLDTIYLFSDGLPNLGDGVPSTIARPSETQKNHYLSKFVREKLKSEWNRPAANLNDVRINAVGFFFESPDVGAFLWALAREHKGSFVGLR